MAAFFFTNSKGKTYYFYRGPQAGMYYASGSQKDGALTEKPADRVIVENARTGLPMLKRA